ncbi:putative peptidase A1 family protein [Teratosphaeria destructans]|uniref:Peptidase A1 family protein n=1 Tax=Teratosphaeria destructans TaxID=418781 RepID=A0A9W7W4J2_9PEZI|nr:putative peptidase A1 family protein [Teratosphaeria destructans]
MHLLPSALLAISVGFAFGVNVEPRATTLPAPISFAPDGNWDGIDGQWSTFTLRVGNPEQVIRTLISFQSYQTWVIGPQGCQTAGDVGACTQQRGDSYNNQTSSTAEYIGIYDLIVDEDLGLVSDAIFVYDTLGLGRNGENGPTLRNTTVGQMAADAFYLGMFGLDPKPTNFTSFSDGSPSYMTLLKQQGYIPSISAGYTAGAQYRFTGELASLILGGYDRAKFVPNEVEFDFAADSGKYLMVGLQSITTSSSVPSSPVGTELLPGAVYALLDTTVAEIWLPLEACRAFEEVFGIEYDNATELYLVNQTLHDKLKAANPTINFTLGQALTGGPTIQIELPYSAFDLTAKPPYQYVSNNSYYFPLRRAANDTQYTIGRTFFQEAYLTVNWESQRFNVSQRIWNDTSSESIVTVPSFNGTSAAYINPGIFKTGGKQGLSEGAMAGIAVGAFTALVLLVLFLFWIWLCRRKAARARAENEKLGHLDHDDSTFSHGARATVFPEAQLDGSSPSSTRSPGGIRDVDTTPGSPNNASWPANGRDSLSTPVRSQGTHAATQSSSQVGTSILETRSIGNPREADSRERAVSERAADFLPTIMENDGKALSEKEAMLRREKIYSGVEQKVLIRHPSLAARGPRREVVGRASLGSVVPNPRLSRSSMSMSSLAGPAGRPASRVSSNGEKRSISGLELTSPASRASLHGSSRNFDGVATQGRNSPCAGNSSIERVALYSDSQTGARRIVGETGPSSSISPGTLVSPVIQEARSVDGSALESPFSPVAAGRSKMGDRASLSVHRTFSFEK